MSNVPSIWPRAIGELTFNAIGALFAETFPQLARSILVESLSTCEHTSRCQRPSLFVDVDEERRAGTVIRYFARVSLLGSRASCFHRLLLNAAEFPGGAHQRVDA